jgi:hypothetical protein
MWPVVLASGAILAAIALFVIRVEIATRMGQFAACVARTKGLDQHLYRSGLWGLFLAAADAPSASLVPAGRGCGTSTPRASGPGGAVRP